jgi:hypothetical protein
MCSQGLIFGKFAKQGLCPNYISMQPLYTLASPLLPLLTCWLVWSWSSVLRAITKGKLSELHSAWVHGCYMSCVPLFLYIDYYYPPRNTPVAHSALCTKTEGNRLFTSQHENVLWYLAPWAVVEKRSWSQVLVWNKPSHDWVGKILVGGFCSHGTESNLSIKFQLSV